MKGNCADPIEIMDNRYANYLLETDCQKAYAAELYCLGMTKLGQPRHPLYLKKSLRPILWVPHLAEQEYPPKGAQARD